MEPRSGPKSPHQRHQKLGIEIEACLAKRYPDPGMPRPVCVVIDVMMSWSKEIFEKFGVPVVSFFTSGACSSAVDYASWIGEVGEMKPGETRIFDGLPHNMGMSYSDLKRLDRRRHHMHGRNPDGPAGLEKPIGPVNERRHGPPVPGSKPRWLEEEEGSIALFFNTCDDLEGPFINYLAKKIDKPVYGIGPLLPERYWKSFDSVFHDNEVRSKRESNYTEDQVVQWLDKKPSQSVIYVSFGSEVGPTLEEYDELSYALEELNRPFIWVIQPNAGISGPLPGFHSEIPGSQPKEEGYYPIGLDKKVGERGLIIKGWAPQLLILSHPSIGGFLSHCGWNSTLEAIGRGVPILTWPIRGDQFYNAKLIVNHLKVGHHLLNNENDSEETVKKGDIRREIDLLMDDGEVYKQAKALRSKFKDGFLGSSLAALKLFVDGLTIQKD